MPARRLANDCQRTLVVDVKTPDRLPRSSPKRTPMQKLVLVCVTQFRSEPLLRFVRISDGQKVRLWTLSPGRAKVYAAMPGSALAKNYEAMLAKQSDTVVPTEAEEIDDLLA